MVSHKGKKTEGTEEIHVTAALPLLPLRILYEKSRNEN
jgi:hypothetical protein